MPWHSAAKFSSSRASTMPAQRRFHDGDHDDPLQSIRNNYHYDHDEEGGDDSDRSTSPSSGGDKDEFVIVNVAEIRKEVQCPICLGIIRKTRTVMECLHRFCRECIDKSMRLGNNECPACRTHCASRRSLRDDPNYDALIAALYPDIDRYEREELTFHEEEKALNNQIQASIAQTLRRQSEALSRKKTSAKGSILKQSDVNSRSAHMKGRKNCRATESSDDDDEEEEEDGIGITHDDSRYSSFDEHIEANPKRCKRVGNAGLCQYFTTNGCGDENDGESSKDSLGLSTASGLVCTSEMLVWGKGGMRSHTRFGGANANGCRSTRNNRISRLADHFRHLEDFDSEMDVHVMLVSFDEQQMPTLRRPFLCCRSTLSVRHLCQFVAVRTRSGLQENEIEILAARKQHPEENLNPSSSISIATIVHTYKDALQILEPQKTLNELDSCSLIWGHPLLVYRKNLTRA